MSFLYFYMLHFISNHTSLQIRIKLYIVKSILEMIIDYAVPIPMMCVYKF